MHEIVQRCAGASLRSWADGSPAEVQDRGGA
jgi:hypothetical protein